MILRAVYVVVLVLPIGAVAAKHFQEWFPQYGPSLDARMLANCTTRYDDYLNGSSNYCSQYSSQSACLAGQVVDCILDYTSESTKANMAAAAVLLGILPTILSQAGSSTVEISLLALRRPLLAFLLAAGTPAIAPLRSVDYLSVEDLLSKRNDFLTLPTLTRSLAVVSSIFQYTLACGAIANLAYASWQLCYYTLCSFAPDSLFLPALWAFLALPIHIAGVLALLLCLQRPKASEVSWNKNQFKLSIHQEPVYLEFRSASYFFICMAWVTSTATILHIIFGTLVFSSILFIGTGDALIVAARYLASTLICRIILMFELSGMKQAKNLDEDEGQDLSHLGGQQELSDFNAAPRRRK